jgi:N,N'-diacetyllegionaminate synthase
MDKLKIGDRLIGAGERPYIVAEIGSNHNGDMALCRELIERAKLCGADAVKFQSWTKRSLVSKAEYERNTQYAAATNGATLEQEIEKYQLTPEQHYEVADYCRSAGICFFSSCFSKEEVDLLDSLDVPVFKIASMDINHLLLLQYAASKKRPVVLSTGLATLGEIERAIETLRQAGAASIVLMHCLSIYPSPPEIVNLRNMAMLETAFNLPVGYSDHSIGTSIPLAAIALGACMIEKHFTLDKSMAGWDHSISSDPAELSYLVREGLNVFEALGGTTRSITPDQVAKRMVFRRRLVLCRPVKSGQTLTLDDFDFKRPGTGINPDEFGYLIGRIANRDLECEQELEWTDLR